ncbi:MAG: ABC transporter permease [Proteobacteria bacterium]|nr:ABC transporter permease [Pseudomonadota bacterium]
MSAPAPGTPAAGWVEEPPRPSLWRIFALNRMSVLGLAVLGCLLVLAVFGDAIVPFDPEKIRAGPRMASPGAVHLMGTDDLGRDVFSRVLAGLRISLIVGLSAAAVSTGIGIVVGSFAGYFGRLIDDLLMRLTEVFLVIPRFFLAIMLVAFFGAHIVNIILAIALLSWPEIARIVRAEFLSLRTRQFVDAARIAGCGVLVLMFVEILPNALAPVVVAGTLQVGQAMLLEAGLSYLGLGDPSQVSLGIMLQQAQQIMRSAWWTTAFPGLVIFLAVLSLNLVGDGLNDVLSPRSRGR